MGTSYEVVYETFLDIIKEDVEFFEYRGLSIAQSQEIILKQCKKYLKEACVRISPLLVEYDKYFVSRDDTLEQFEHELTDEEIDVIASVMYEKHVEKGLAEFKAINTFLYDADVKQLNPTTERKEYVKFVNDIIEKNNAKINNLQSVEDRKMKLPNYDER